MAPILVFDLDDTLFPEHEFVRSGFRAVGEWLHAHHNITGFAVEAQALFDSGLRGTVFDRALERMKVEEPRPLVRDLVRVYREHAPRISLHPDAAWALEHFRSTHALGLLTDGFLITQRNKVRALGIETMFNVVVYSDEDGRDAWKPSEIPYRRVMAETGVTGGDCVYISDNPAKDFVRARELGWHTVHIARPDGVYRDVRPADGYAADVRIDTLHDLESVLPWSHRPTDT